ncbi:MAG: hypothetical protein ABI678_21590, partial [Kofleriaceae bacterium]
MRRIGGADGGSLTLTLTLALTLIASLFAALPAALPAVGSDDPARAEAIARVWLTEHEPGSEFVVVANRLDEGIRSVGFEQRWHGMKVIGGQVGFVFAHDKLTLVLPRVVEGLHPIEARVRGERVVLRTASGDRIVAHVREGDDDVYRDDRGEVARESRRRAASGTLEYNAGVRYASGARDNTNARTAAITVNGVATTTTTTGGFTWPGSADATVAPSCTGTEVMVVNAAGGAASASLTVQAGGGVIWNAANSELDDAQISTYVYGTAAAERAKRIDPAASAWLAPFVFYVNETNPCNAFSTGDAVHLARGATECENTGRVADVVYHEFGHALHFHEVISGVGSYQLQLSEGLADFNAANLTEDPGIGRGLDFTDVAQRELDPPGRELRYPTDVTPDNHASGDIIAGALWDLRKALIAELGHDRGVALVEKIFLGVMRRAQDLPTSYAAALVADDDDGDLANGTPHRCQIQHAFGVHGLAPDFADTTIGTPTFAGSTITVPVTLGSAGPCPARQVVAMHVLWKVGDEIANDLDLAYDGTAWTGSIPVQPEGTALRYSVDVTLDDGVQLAYPDNPADPMYQVFLGTTTPIWCDSFDHAPTWTAGGSTPSEWQWARPSTAGRFSGDPSIAHTGEYTYGTNLANGGAYGAGETMTATTPTIDTSAFQIIRLQYWRWLTVEDSARDQAEIIASTDLLWRNATNLATSLAHVDREWRFQDIDLTPHLYYNTIAVTWQLATDGTTELGGWNLDDVCVVGMAKVGRCGDAYLDLGEQCDDGNTFSGDGCSDVCVDELEAGGGGGCCSASG